MATTKDLTGMQKRFAEEYVRLQNMPGCRNPVSQAALNAGYAKKSAYSTATANLKHPQIVAYITSLLEKQHKRAEKAAESVKITPEYVLNGIADLAERESTRDGDRLRAYELLGRYLALFTDRQETKAEVSGQISFTFDKLDGDLSG